MDTSQSGKFCEYCNKPANNMLEFTYHGEPYGRAYYCDNCVDNAWESGTRYADYLASRAQAIADGIHDIPTDLPEGDL